LIITKPGKVTDRILLLGIKESSVYILKGKDEYAFLGGGMVHIVPEIIEQLKKFKIEEKKIQQIIILHSHFDHCGVVPFLKRRWPWAKITASQRAKELLAAPNVIETIEFMNQALLKEKGREDQAKDLRLEFTGINVEEVVKDDDIISCGDLTIEIIEVPGHSSCSIAAYVPEEKAMFASDAGLTCPKKKPCLRPMPVESLLEIKFSRAQIPILINIRKALKKWRITKLTFTLPNTMAPGPAKMPTVS